MWIRKTPRNSRLQESESFSQDTRTRRKQRSGIRACRVSTSTRLKREPQIDVTQCLLSSHPDDPEPGDADISTRPKPLHVVILKSVLLGESRSLGSLVITGRIRMQAALHLLFSEPFPPLSASPCRADAIHVHNPAMCSTLPDAGTVT